MNLSYIARLQIGIKSNPELFAHGRTSYVLPPNAADPKGGHACTLTNKNNYDICMTLRRSNLKLVRIYEKNSRPVMARNPHWLLRYFCLYILQLQHFKRSVLIRNEQPESIKPGEQLIPPLLPWRQIRWPTNQSRGGGEKQEKKKVPLVILVLVGDDDASSVITFRYMRHGTSYHRNHQECQRTSDETKPSALANSWSSLASWPGAVHTTKCNKI